MKDSRLQTIPPRLPSPGWHLPAQAARSTQARKNSRPTGTGSIGGVGLISSADGSRTTGQSPPAVLRSEKAELNPLADSDWSSCLRRFQAGAFGEKQAHGGTTMVFAHRGLKIRRRQVFGMGLMRAPFHEQAVADAAEQARHEHRIGVANAAAIVVVGNVQALVQTVFNAGKARRGSIPATFVRPVPRVRRWLAA